MKSSFLASGRQKYPKIQFHSPLFPIFIFPTCTEYLMTLLSHPTKESTEDTVSSQTNLGQELRRWWLAPPGGRTGEQRLLPGKKQVKEAPLHTILPLSLSSPLLSATFEIWAHLLVLILSSREPSNKHFRYQLLRWPIFFRI